MRNISYSVLISYLILNITSCGMSSEEGVNSAVYPSVWTIIPSMVLVLMGPLSSFWLVRWLWLRKYPETTVETESVPIQDDDPPVIELDES